MTYDIISDIYNGFPMNYDVNIIIRYRYTCMPADIICTRSTNSDSFVRISKSIPGPNLNRIKFNKFKW